MYNLGDHFKRDLNKAVANKDAIIQGNKYRITILKDSLFRFEYNPDGKFIDLPSELIWYRFFEKPEFEIQQDEKYIIITTKTAKISYTKEKPFKGTKINPSVNLKVELLGSERSWYFGHPEIRNLGAPGIQVENKKGKTKFKKGLYSTDGFVSIDDSKSRLLLENGTYHDRDINEIDTYLFTYNNDFSTCLKNYYDITGYPALIPRYALGTWWSKDDTYDDITLKELINQFNHYKIPLSVLILNKSWHKQVNDRDNIDSGFTFDKDHFKSPYSMISYLHEKGIRVGLNIDPFDGFYPIDDYYNKALEYIKPDEKGVIPFNVYDPKTVDLYFKLFIHPLDALGIDFYWINQFEKEAKDELTALKHYHMYDMMRDYKRRPMILGQNTLLAPHRYPVLYSGKTVVGWNALKLIPLYNSTASNIGVSWWSHDIGGYHKGIEDSELYIRYVQLGTFSPIMKFGAASGKYYKRAPWLWDIKTYAITEDYLTLRNKLIPYLYSEAYKYSKNGAPLIQPIYYQYHDLYDDPLFKNEYYFGSEFLISPIITSKDPVMNRVIHKFFIPEGIWYDFFTGKKFPGGKDYVSFFKDEDYPVFAKAGSIIPFGYNEALNDTNPPKHMEVHVFPGKSNTYTMYEDDGISDLYLKDFYLLTAFDYNYMPNNYTIIIRCLEGKSGIVPDNRDYKIIFRNTRKADEVIVYENQERKTVESYIEGTNFVVVVKDVNIRDQLTINCKGKDIEYDAVRVINNDIQNILSDLPIETEMKERIDKALFGDEVVKKKRILIRKLGRKGLEHKFVKLFLKLLEYVEQL